MSTLLADGGPHGSSLRRAATQHVPSFSATQERRRSNEKNHRSEAYAFQLDHDSDGDGLWDGWENNGIPIPGGTAFYSLPDADPQHKDLYVAVDAMDGGGLAPSQSIFADIEGVFANSPVDNPDGKKGIKLHIEYIESNLPTQDYPNVWVEFDQNKLMWFGSPTERGDPNRDDLLTAKAEAYRYCIFAEKFGGSDSSGFAEIGGNDFAVTLGLWGVPGGGFGGTAADQSGTFLHELGHTLGLEHGGAQVDQNDDRYNYKPNYYSVMNYMWQVEWSWHTAGALLDYSRSRLPDLDEADLDEQAGLGATFPILPAFRSIPFNAEPSATMPPMIKYAMMAFGAPVDWDADGMIDSGPVQMDVNRVLTSLSPTPGDVLQGYHDWGNLAYVFRFNESFADGVHSSSALDDELDLATAAELDSLPPPVVSVYCSGKQNSDGCLPMMTYSGIPSVTDPNPFFVEAQDVVANTTGFLIYGTAWAEIPYQNGTICVMPEYGSPFLASGGTGPCGGAFSYDMNAVIQGAANPAALVGVRIYAVGVR